MALDENIRQIAHDYQEATGIGLPFNGTDEEMIYALKLSFRERANAVRNLRARDIKVKEFIKEMIM